MTEISHSCMDKPLRMLPAGLMLIYDIDTFEPLLEFIDLGFQISRIKDLDSSLRQFQEKNTDQG